MLIKTGDEFIGSPAEAELSQRTAAMLHWMAKPAIGFFAAQIKNAGSEPFYTDHREGGSEAEHVWLQELGNSPVLSDRAAYDEMSRVLERLPEGGMKATKFKTIDRSKPGADLVVGADNPATTDVAKKWRLRSLTLDELPQLEDAAKGDYLMVGRRGVQLKTHLEIRQAVGPEMHDEWLKLPIGLTGLGQIAGHGLRHSTAPDAWRLRVNADLWWAPRASAPLNTRIILKTMPGVVAGTLRPADSAAELSSSLYTVEEDPKWLTSRWYREKVIPLLVGGVRQPQALTEANLGNIPQIEVTDQ